LGAYTPRKFLGLRFTYHEDGDEELLDEALHYELSSLQAHIKEFCESLFTWDILDEDQKSKYSARLYPSVWIPLTGISGIFPRKDYPRYFRQFDLQVSVVTEETASFSLFEEVTELLDVAPYGLQEVATVDFELSRLGLRAQERYRPSTGGEGRQWPTVNDE
jgi:hypothetical protein